VHRGRPHARAFTLTELLIVIGIIALLIGILLPTLKGARRQAHLVQCAANIRSMIQACQTHAQDKKGYLPLAGHIVVPAATPWEDYPAGLNDAGRTRFTYAPSPDAPIAVSVVPFPAALAPHLGIRDLPMNDWHVLDQALNDKRGVWRRFMCPDIDSDEKQKYNGDPNDHNYAGQGTMMVCAIGDFPVIAWSTNSDYAVNEGVMGYHWDPRYAKNRLGGHVARARRTSEVALFTDALPRKEWAIDFFPIGWICWTPKLDNAQPATLGDAFANNGKASGKDNFDVQRHRGRMNVGFLDGHVEAVPITKPTLDKVYLVPPN
jgi:prepilin-type processing-associated H-X9-DG protein/prepilin-type N-terminal cleavage/methylation domain-containing protein